MAVEIEPMAAAEAAQNAAQSPFGDRVSVVHDDFLSFEPEGKFDLIVCNPPFFTETTKAPDRARAAARSEGTLTIGALMRKSAKLLSADGRLSIIAPADRDSEIEFEAAMAGLSEERRCAVSTVASKPPRRTLWSFAFSACSCSRSVLSIQDREHGYTKEYVELVSNFYIKL